ncbi:2OG-Fe dioxygenase family protein [Halomonas desiderata]|uniref:2OG-Fe dioxygenase family protein n=1 Tax=Halomonadaceae TaxID=28256 RepID=UPI000A39A34C|nr:MULTISPECIES: 2OG-Fe dioxygenase family protein [Halomonas]MCE8040146.1 2OG-Fe dioxygenase family protein [Halomonas sp. MCCC 1A11062]NIC37055.1 2OG-Fe dioxygenase family protein [Halomonas desiderata]
MKSFVENSPIAAEVRSFAPAQPPIDNLCKLLAQKDYCFLTAKKMQDLLYSVDETSLEDWKAFQDSWNRLQQDSYMRDGGTYRYRRHATYSAVPSGNTARLEAHQPHYQSTDYNTLNGGIARDFAHIEDAIISNKVMIAALEFCCACFTRLAPYYAWHIEVHQFRIDASHTRASPTPEGIHRDGVNFVFMMLVNRINVVNGETSIYNLDKKRLSSYTLATPFEAAIVNDERVMHGVTPIINLDKNNPGYRDVLVITFSKC